MTANPSGWRPSAPANEQGEARTVTGNRALMVEEPLIFEIGSIEQTGVDFDDFLPGRTGTIHRRVNGGGGGVPGSSPLRQRFALPPPRPGRIALSEPRTL